MSSTPDQFLSVKSIFKDGHYLFILLKDLFVLPERRNIHMFLHLVVSLRYLLIWHVRRILIYHFGTCWIADFLLLDYRITCLDDLFSQGNIRDINNYAFIFSDRHI